MKVPYPFIFLSIFYLLISGDPAVAQDDPFVDDGEYGLPQQIRIYTESYEVRALEFAKLMAGANKNSNHDELRNTLLAKAKKDQAKLISNHSVICLNGERADIESITEYIYATEYEYSPPPPLMQESDLIEEKNSIIFPFQPDTPMVFETRNLGHWLQIEATLGEDSDSVDLRIHAETVEHVGDKFISSFVAPYVTSKDTMPIFYTKRLNSSVTVNDGEFLLASTFSPDLDGKTDHTRKILYFVRAEILTVGKK